MSLRSSYKMELGLLGMMLTNKMEETLMMEIVSSVPLSLISIKIRKTLRNLSQITTMSLMMTVKKVMTSS